MAVDSLYASLDSELINGRFFGDWSGKRWSLVPRIKVLETDSVKHSKSPIFDTSLMGNVTTMIIYFRLASIVVVTVFVIRNSQESDCRLIVIIWQTLRLWFQWASVKFFFQTIKLQVWKERLRCFPKNKINYSNHDLKSKRRNSIAVSHSSMKQNKSHHHHRYVLPTRWRKVQILGMSTVVLVTQRSL